MDDAFEIIEEDAPALVQRDDDRVLLRELLEKLGTQKLIVEQEDIDVNISEPQDVDGPIIEDYFCENGVSDDPFPEKVIPRPDPVDFKDLSEDTSRTQSTEPKDPLLENLFDLPFEKENNRFFINPYLAPQNLSASVMLTTPLTDLAKPISLTRRNSLPILCREREGIDDIGFNFSEPKAPDRSRSTPVQSPATVSAAGDEIETALSLPSNGLNLLEDENAGENLALPTFSASISQVSDDKEDVEPSADDIEKTSPEDVGSSAETVACTICLSTPIDILPNDIPPKLSADFLTVACASFTIFPIYQERKNQSLLVYIKITDLVFAMIVAATIYWSYRLQVNITQRIFRTNLTNCESQQIITSTPHSNYSYFVDK